MCLMNNVLLPYLEIFMIVFVDDILVYFKTKKEHEKHLTVVLQLLREHNIYSNLNKRVLFES